jgi:murein tripeptide amidase MpaA
MVNPDGVVLGNYRKNLQGKDMNRHFFADEKDNENNELCTEVELIKAYMKENLAEKKRLKLFLDIHAHSRKRSVFVYAPKPPDVQSITRIQHFSQLLEQNSPIFSQENCSYNNDQRKANCARLGIFNNYGLVDSYTVEASCWGFD